MIIVVVREDMSCTQEFERFSHNKETAATYTGRKSWQTFLDAIFMAF